MLCGPAGRPAALAPPQGLSQVLTGRFLPERCQVNTAEAGDLDFFIPQMIMT